MITFERDNYHVQCDSGIETRNCKYEANWVELENGWHIIGRFCDSCKIEVETYVQGQNLQQSEQAKQAMLQDTIKKDPVLIWLEQAIEQRKKELADKYPVKPVGLSGYCLNNVRKG